MIRPSFSLPSFALSLVVASASYAQPEPIVVVTHGFALDGELTGWMFELADEMRDRVGSGRVLVYEPATGAFETCGHPACDDPPSGDGPVFLVMDWAAQSNDLGSGFSEAAAEALTSALVEHAQSGADPEVDLAQLHLVGHSRGAVVNSEVAERLIAAGLPAPAQMTTLDPHDDGGGLRAAFATAEEWQRLRDVRGGLDDLDVNQEHPEYADEGYLSWSGLGYHDNYWRTGCLPNPFDPDGEFLPGAMNFDMTAVGGFLDDICHSDVHSWYRLTVTQGGAPSPWFDAAATTCGSAARTTPLAQNIDGFNGSPLGGAAPACPTDPPNQQEVLFRWDLLEGIVNGGFERSGSGSNTHAGWSFDGGGGNATISGGELEIVTGQFREHSRLLVPPQATAVEVCWRALDPGTGQSDLRLSICAADTPGDCADRLVWSALATTPTARTCALAPLLESERGRGARLRFDLVLVVPGTSADLRVDEVRWQQAVFWDGFESGDLQSWSASSP